MEGDARRLGEGLEPLLEQLGVHLAELGPGEGDLPDEIGPVRRVEATRVSVSSIGIIACPVARDAGPVAERLRHRLADDIAGVLGGVVEVDVQIAHRAQRDVDQAVPGQLLEHVVEKADAGRDLGDAGAVEIDATGDLGLLGVAFDRRHPHRASPRGPRLRRRRCINFTDWLPLLAPGLTSRSACCPDPCRLHLSRPGAFEEPHGTIRQDRLARHDDPVRAQERPGRDRRRRPGLNGPDGGQVERPQIAPARRRLGDRRLCRRHRRRDHALRTARGQARTICRASSPALASSSPRIGGPIAICAGSRR